LFGHLNTHTPAAFRRHTAIWFIALLSAGCASHPPSPSVAIINRGERLIATHGNGGSQQSSAGRQGSIDSSKRHLLEIYNGQQKIIERMEALQRKKEEQRLGQRSDDFTDIAEGAAAPLPDDISSSELLRILEKQQSLIQALSSNSRN
jgi:hypothetical protein